MDEIDLGKQAGQLFISLLYFEHLIIVMLIISYHVSLPLKLGRFLGSATQLCVIISINSAGASAGMTVRLGRSPFATQTAMRASLATTAKEMNMKSSKIVCTPSSYCFTVDSNLQYILTDHRINNDFPNSITIRRVSVHY